MTTSTNSQNLAVYPAIYMPMIFFPIENNGILTVKDKRFKNAIFRVLRDISVIEGAPARFAGRTIVLLLSDLPAEMDNPSVLKEQVMVNYGGVAIKVRIDKFRLKREGGEQVFELNVHGAERIVIDNIMQLDPYCQVSINPFGKINLPDRSIFELLKKEMFYRIQELDKFDYKGDNWTLNCRSEDDATSLIDAVIFNALDILKLAPFSTEEQRQLMAEPDVLKKWKTMILRLERELVTVAVNKDINKKTKKSTEGNNREVYLRMQMAAIKQELGEETPKSRIKELEKRLDAAKMPQEAFFAARRELRRLKYMNRESHEFSIAYDYITWLIDLPWDKETKDNISLADARKILDEDHYDMEKIKKRIREYLAVRQLNPDKKGPILCLVGPPGVGKTSSSKSVARALGRKFARISLGGIRDEAEIRGHRRTYTGALPGRIIQAIRRAGSKNPVIGLDEVDKMGSDWRGDPVSALLEVLDPEENRSFSDHYLGVEFDLSGVIFICMANSLDTIPPPLLDRLEALYLPGYTRDEKLQIAKNFLVKKQLEENGVEEFCGPEFLTDDCLQCLISGYTREAGVRDLERKIAEIFRYAAVKKGKNEALEVQISKDNLHQILGPEPYGDYPENNMSQPGTVTGLAVTNVEGCTLIINARKMPGEGKFILTGNLKDVLKESATVARSFAINYLSRFELDPSNWEKNDIHIECEEGSIPKNGASAGLSLAMSLVSMFLKRPVRPDVAFTGEITLRGLILPVGGIRDKILAAERAGNKHVIIPKRNEKDLVDVPESVKSKIDIRTVSHFKEIVEFALYNR